ncbi:MAG: ArgE/DapE family deacylase [Gemmatimonadaceae bacterium]
MRREASAPRGDALALTRALVAIDSRNPALADDGPGERAAAEHLAEVLTAWGFAVDLLEALPGRPCVVARIGGGHGGRSLLLNGHLDTVGVEGMTHPPFTPAERDGRLYGRGSADMKGGIAAMCAAAARAADHDLGGEVVLAIVVDEEWASAGTKFLLEAGITAHAAIVTEPTRLAICPAHRGFAWADVTVHGRAAHGSRYDIGVDAITHAAHLIAELDAFQARTLAARTHPLLGHASLHVGTIQGGSGISTYPERCTFSVERRTLPGERGADFFGELDAAIQRVGARVPAFRADVTPQLVQEPNDVPPDHPLIAALSDASAKHGGRAPIEGLSCWTDAALLSAAGIPALCYGPGDIALAHAAEEWVPVAEIVRATDVLTETIIAWCGPKGVAWGS